jgi:pimeloyl-ACP methyl ester carboxylesterase
MAEGEYSPETQTSFAAQFANVEKHKVAGGTAEVVDIRPEYPKTEIPVVFAPAWGCSTEVYKPALEALSTSQRRVISLDHPRIGGRSEEVVPDEIADQYPTATLRKSLNILGILEKKGIEKTDVIAHSEGAINTVLAATLHPEKFRNIVLVAPAGLIGEDKFTRLLQGFAGQGKRAESLSEMPLTEEERQKGYSAPEIPISETEKHVTSIAATEALKYLLKNPVRGINEARGIATSQIHDMLRYLHERGIGIVVMSGVDDPVFPMERMQEIVKTDMLDGFVSLRGGHGEIGNHPDRYMTAAEKMITSLEEKRGRNTGENPEEHRDHQPRTLPEK